MAKIDVNSTNPDHVDVQPLPVVAHNPFKRANAAQSHIRIVLTGAAGSGKTYTALALATALSRRKIALIDTESDSATLYAGQFVFDTLNLRRFTPRYYIQAVESAAKNGYDVCIIDSLTHSWNGTGGILDIAGGNIRGWKDASPEYRRLVDTLTTYRSQMHIICTLRSKMEYRITQEPGSPMVVTKIGLQPIHRDELPYEFDAVIDLNQQHQITVSKARYAGLDGLSLPAGRESIDTLATALVAWRSALNEGEE